MGLGAGTHRAAGAVTDDVRSGHAGGDAAKCPLPRHPGCLLVAPASLLALPALEARRKPGPEATATAAAAAAGLPWSVAVCAVAVTAAAGAVIAAVVAQRLLRLPGGESAVSG